MDKQQFNALAQQGYTRIPVVKRILADLETPLSIYLKLANQPYSYLLESVEGGEQWGRYSIIGLPCQTIIKAKDSTITLEQNGQVVETITAANPFKWIEEFHQRYRVPDLENLPRFSGGLVGYFGYDTVRYVEPRLAHSANPDDINAPDILLLVSDELVVFDNLNHTLFFIIHVDPQQEHAYDTAQARLEQLIHCVKQLPAPSVISSVSQSGSMHEFVSNTSATQYENAISKIKNYIKDGDVMQVVFSHRMSAPFHANSLNLYRALRYLNPSPYMFYFKLPDFDIVGASPEVLVRLENKEITLRPLAGTRSRGKTAVEDQMLEQQLLADPKERAEHLMLIDLGRNDVGRVSDTASVKVTKMMVVERYSHVMHISSTVVGTLKSGYTALDALQAALPAGTLSGAPKVRAMEIIDELEIAKRGIYGGAVGYFAWNGNMDTAIALRTAIIKNNTLYVQAGGGIVADSQCEEEWQETQRKARAIMTAAALAEDGLTL